MSLLSTFPPYNTSGGGASYVYKRIPTVSSSFFTLPANASSISHVELLQLNASQFAVSYTYFNTSNNLHYYYCIPFQVDSSGTITIGSAGAATNSSSSAYGWSTTLNTEVYPGETCLVSRMTWTTGTYQMVSGSVKVSASNTATVYFNTSGSDYGSNYPHPYAPIFPTSSPTAATRYVTYQGYNPSSQGYYTSLSSTTGNFNFSGTGTAIGDSYSGFAYGRSIQRWSDTTARTGFYAVPVSTIGTLYEVHSNGTFSNVGGSSFFPDNVGLNCLKLPSGNRFYISPSGNSITTNGTGTRLSSSRIIVPYPFVVGGASNNYSYRRLGALDTSGTFYSFNTTLNTGQIFKITEDTVNYNHTCSILDNFSLSPLANPLLSSTGLVKFAGASNQFIVSADQSGVVVYDSSTLTLS